LQTFALQYSDTASCAPLDEDHLDETAGVQCGSASTYVVYWAPGNFAGSAPGGFSHHASATTGTAVNWDGDAANMLETDVAVDLNNDSAHQVHRAMNDWTALHVDTSCYDWTLLDGSSLGAATASEQTAAEIARTGRTLTASPRP
jgi:hypothetical protein